MRELTKVDLSAGPFKANGKLYTVSNTFSLDRYKMYENIELEMGYGRAWADIYDEGLKVYDALNRSKFADASVMMHNLIQGVKNVKNKMPHAMRMCALFINYEGEDVRYISEQIIQQKIFDWNEEGLDPEPFLTFGVNSMRGFQERYKKLTQDSSPLS
ncbi:MAG: hypothetical protein QM802_19890 [Agriterribacter sp.]